MEVLVLCLVVSNLVLTAILFVATVAKLETISIRLHRIEHYLKLQDRTEEEAMRKSYG